MIEIVTIITRKMCLNQTSKCNSFEVIKHLLRVAKVAITHSILAQNE